MSLPWESSSVPTAREDCHTRKEDWFAMTGRGEAAVPSLVGKVAHAKRVTDELSSRFSNNSVPLNRKTVES